MLKVIQPVVSGEAGTSSPGLGSHSEQWGSWGKRGPALREGGGGLGLGHWGCLDEMGRESEMPPWEVRVGFLKLEAEDCFCLLLISFVSKNINVRLRCLESFPRQARVKRTEGRSADTSWGWLVKHGFASGAHRCTCLFL